MRSGKHRRAASESAALEESFDGSFSFSAAHDESSARASPLLPQLQLPGSPNGKRLVSGSPRAQANEDLPVSKRATGNISAVHEEEEEEEEEVEAGDAVDDDYPVPSTWGNEPTPEQLQQIQDRVSAWLHTSRPSPSPSSGLRFPSSIDNSALVEVPEEDSADENDNDVIHQPLAVRVQPLRVLDSISEDEPPPFAGSSVSTAPSTPLPLSSLPHPRSRSQSPPLRRRSLEAQDEYYPRGLDTIQEAGDSLPISLPSPRRSLDSAKRPSSLVLESIPEIDIPPSASSPKRRLGIKGFGFARSESEPLMPTLRNMPFNPSTSAPSSNLGSANYLFAKRKTPPSLSLNGLTGANGAKAAGRMATKERPTSSPTLPSFQRGTNVVMGQQPRSTPSPTGIPKRTQNDLRKPLSPRTYSLGTIAAHTELIEDDESRRLTEVAFLG